MVLYDSVILSVVSLVSLAATTSDGEFEGYIIQGRLSADGTTIVGEFNNPQNGRFHSCTPATVR